MHEGKQTQIDILDSLESQTKDIIQKLEPLKIKKNRLIKNVNHLKSVYNKIESIDIQLRDLQQERMSVDEIHAQYKKEIQVIILFFNYPFFSYNKFF